jgi:hypothetical protein
MADEGTRRRRVDACPEAVDDRAVEDQLMTDRAARPRTATWWRSRWALSGALAALAVLFVLENRDEVRSPVVIMLRWAALLTTLVIGFIIGLLLRRRG